MPHEKPSADLPADPPSATPPALLMSLADFSADQDTRQEPQDQRQRRLRIEFGEAACDHPLTETSLFTYADDPVHLVNIFDGERLIAVGAMVGEEGKLGVRIVQVVGEAPSAEAA